MKRFLRRSFVWVILADGGFSQSQPAKEPQPRVVISKDTDSSSITRAASAAIKTIYPWKKYITCTIFWCGEEPCEKNPTPNCKSSWDTNWKENFGGYDDPDPKNRIANHATGEFRPKAFIPKLNPFYIALPYNDVAHWNAHKPEASRVIPWFSRFSPKPGKSVLKSRWVQIYCGKKSCYAQWEDCGPWLTDDWAYVFGNQPPATKSNGSAGIDLSPSIRDYLGIKSGQKVHWRFVEDHQVPYGPWKKYGNHSTQQYHEMRANPDASQKPRDIDADRKYMEELRKRRDSQFLLKPLGQL